jgi:predicted DNA-binding transcriptional regulator AlpA
MTTTNNTHAKARPGAAARPPSYMSRKELAWELSCSETTVDELVRLKRIPAPVRLTNGCVRWWWPAVESAIASVDAGAVDAPADPYMAGAIGAA